MMVWRRWGTILSLLLLLMMMVRPRWTCRFVSVAIFETCKLDVAISTWPYHFTIWAHDSWWWRSLMLHLLRRMGMLHAWWRRAVWTHELRWWHAWMMRMRRSMTHLMMWWRWIWPHLSHLMWTVPKSSTVITTPSSPNINLVYGSDERMNLTRFPMRSLLVDTERYPV